MMMDTLLKALEHPLTILLLQLLVILCAARVTGYLFKLTGQPTVIGEIIAGLLLGPSLLGRLAPGVSHTLFPPASLGTLQQLSNIGLILFLFIIGMELDVDLIRKKAGKALVISQAGIIVPFLLGTGLAFFLYKDFSKAGVPFYVFALFTGIAMSITAFPVLARILREKGMMNTRIGVLTMTCAAADDAVAWCILALIITIAKGISGAGVLYMLLYAIGYMVLMFGIIRPVLALLLRKWAVETLTAGKITLMLGVLLLSAFFTEMIGLHALFGAFIAGIIMPILPALRSALIEQTETIATGLLLPLFFVSTGLKTDVGALQTGTEWLWCGAIILTAITGKFGGCSIAARIMGESWRDSFSIGALMNTRGLMQLVVLTIGYDLGIISAAIFTMMVLMAIFTTMMTAPMLRLFRKK